MSQLAERGDDNPALLAAPARLGAQLRVNMQFVGVGVVAGDAARPAADLSVQQPVLHVLGNLAGDIRLAVGPFADPPAPLGHDVFKHVDDTGRVHAAHGEVVQHPGSSLEQWVGAHAPIVPHLGLAH